MKTYSDTYTFSLFERDYHIKSLVEKMADHRTIVPKDALDIIITSIDKSINVPTKKAILADYNAGILIPFVFDDDFEFPMTIPVFLNKVGDSRKFNALVNITAYAVVKRDPVTRTIVEVKIDEKKLFVLLQTAWFYRKWALEPERIENNVSFVRVSANIFSKLMYKILDKAFAVGVNIGDIDKILAMVSLYYTKYMVGSNHASDIAASIPAYYDKREAKLYMQTIEKTEFKSLEDLTKILSATIPALKKLETIMLVSKYAEVYNGPSVPALDFLPYLIHMVGSAFIGANITKDLLINGIIRTDADDCIKLLYSIYGK